VKQPTPTFTALTALVIGSWPHTDLCLSPTAINLDLSSGVCLQVEL
jgi:hypothetical protein